MGKSKVFAQKTYALNDPPRTYVEATWQSRCSRTLPAIGSGGLCIKTAPNKLKMKSGAHGREWDDRQCGLSG